jgi:hypothetical protein
MRGTCMKEGGSIANELFAELNPVVWVLLD